MTAGAPAEGPLRIRLAVGESTEVVLANVGTAGYQWKHRVEGSEEVLEVTYRRRGDPVPERVVGRAAAQAVLLTARAPGQVRVHLSQGRPWEQHTPPRSSREIEVEVVPAG